MGKFINKIGKFAEMLNTVKSGTLNITEKECSNKENFYLYSKSHSKLIGKDSPLNREVHPFIPITPKSKYSPLMEYSNDLTPNNRFDSNSKTKSIANKSLLPLEINNQELEQLAQAKFNCNWNKDKNIESISRKKVNF